VLKFGFPAKSVADPHVVPPSPPEPELLPEELPLALPELDPEPEPELEPELPPDPELDPEEPELELESPPLPVPASFASEPEDDEQAKAPARATAVTREVERMDPKACLMDGAHRNSRARARSTANCAIQRRAERSNEAPATCHTIALPRGATGCATRVERGEEIPPRGTGVDHQREGGVSLFPL
jgi:hypothetical protein